MWKKGQGLAAALCGAGLALVLAAVPAAAQDGALMTQSERDFMTVDNAATPAKGHQNIMGAIGYTDVGNGGLQIGAWYDMPLSDRLAAIFDVDAAFIDPTIWGLSAGLKYQLGNFGSPGLNHSVIGRIGYTDAGYADGFGGELRWASTYHRNADSISGNLGIGLSDGRSMSVPFGLGWTHRFGNQWRAGLEWGGEIYKGDLYSALGPSIWYNLPASGAQTSIGLNALFGVGDSTGWQLNVMGQWSP